MEASEKIMLITGEEVAREELKNSYRLEEIFLSEKKVMALPLGLRVKAAGEIVKAHLLNSLTNGAFAEDPIQHGVQEALSSSIGRGTSRVVTS